MATPAEQQWLNENPGLVNQFGSNPPDGAVTRFVVNWYNTQPTPPKPDATDAAIFRTSNQYPNAFPAGSPAITQALVPSTDIGGGGTLGGLSGPLSLASQGGSTGGLITDAMNQGAKGALVNPNTQEVMGAIQSGQTVSQGNTNTTGTQSQIGSNNTTSSQKQNVTGNTTNNQVGSTTGTTAGSNTSNTTGANTSITAGNNTGATTGTTSTGSTGLTATQGTSKPIDTLGLGAMLQGQIPGATGATSDQQNFLRNLVTNGPTQQQGLTEKAVANSLSGPGMIGVGDNARARAAGYAGENVGLNSLGQQLQAASQLAGPTAATTLASAGNPFIGQATTGQQATIGGTTGTNNQTTAGTNVQGTTGLNTQSTAGTNNQATIGTSNLSNTGTSNQDLTSAANSLNLSSLLNNTNTNTNENQSGASAAQSGQVGIGNVPTNTQQSSGGCYVCTYWGMNPGVIRRAARWKLSVPKYRRSLAGYSVYGPFAARHFLIPYTVARLVLYEETRLAGLRLPKRLDATVSHSLFHWGSLLVAVLTNTHSIKQCDQRTIAHLSRNNLLFKL